MRKEAIDMAGKPRPPQTIDVSQEWALKYWTLKFHVDERVLKAAVERRPPSERLRGYLFRHHAISDVEPDSALPRGSGQSSNP